MRIYHYISDAKLDMLAVQIAEPFWKKLSASLNIEVPFVKAPHAITAYVAQGMTCRSAFVLARDDVYREWAYTAMSRGRESNRLYVVTDGRSSRDEFAPPEPRREARSRLVAALGQSRPESMASDLRPPPHDRGRGL